MVNYKIPDFWLYDLKGNPFKLIYHPTQDKLINDDYRFKVAAAGRRSGKSFHAKRNLVKQSMLISGHYFAAAPTYGQAKKLYWDDLKNAIPEWYQERRPSESELIIYLANKSQIHIVGLDKPERIEGFPWTGGVIDEIDDCKRDVWYEHIRPAFDTLGLDTWAWLIGVPNGYGLLYDLYTYALTQDDPEWMVYHWLSEDILPDDKILAAKRQLSQRQYNQEYRAEFLGKEGRIYADYGPDNHAECKFNPDLDHIIWTHDFNLTPLSSVIMQYNKYMDTVYCFDEIVLESAVPLQAAKEFCERYKDYKQIPINIYGDASGWIGDKHGQISNYMILRNHLSQEGFNVNIYVRRYNRSIKDGQNAVRAYIKNNRDKIRFYVNPKTCKYVHQGLNTCEYKVGSTFQEDDKNKYSHILTAIRYYFHESHPISNEKNEENLYNENIESRYRKQNIMKR